MRKVTTTTTSNTTTNTQVQISKTPYWLNLKSSISNVGINLASGIKQHDVWLGLINELGIDELNEYLTEINEPYYVVQEGISSQPTHISSLADKIRNRKSA